MNKFKKRITAEIEILCITDNKSFEINDCKN